MPITSVGAHQILDSRGVPTVEVHIATERGVVTGAAPSGSSIGRHEAVELRDHNLSSFLGLSVEKAISSVNTVIGPSLIGRDPTEQAEIDKKMKALDGTEDLSKLGANAILATSVAIAKAGATQTDLPLFAYFAKIAENTRELKIPTPMFNMINGGLHGTGNLDFQEFLIVPAQRFGYSYKLKMGDEIYLNLKQILARKSLLTSVGEEGGFTPSLFTNAAALDLLTEAARESGYKLGDDVFISLDVAANEIKHGSQYFVKDSSGPFSIDGLINFYQNLVGKYLLLSLEDPFAEDDWEGWKKLNKALGSSTLIVGDDLTVTNPGRLKQAISEQTLSGVIVKPNQVGTIADAIEVTKIARANEITVVASHRSGETEDTFIADFAVGVGAEYFKGGAPARGERTAKYNRFLEIEAELAAKTA